MRVRRTNDAAAPEPTEEEYDGACAEATRELENAVTGINDALEELRQELADLLEDDVGDHRRRCRGSSAPRPGSSWSSVGAALDDDGGT